MTSKPWWVALLLLCALPTASEEVREFGAGIQLSETTPLEAVMSEPSRYSEKPILLEGRITDLCMKKGCWTVITDGERALRVRFQDYGFFLPQGELGAKALVEGVAEERTLSKRQARHLASESRDGKPEEIDGPQKVIGFVATGVRLLERPERKS